MQVEYFAWKEQSSSRTVTCTGPGRPHPACKSTGSDITETTYTNQPEWTTTPDTNFKNPAMTLQQSYDKRANQQIARPCTTPLFRGVPGSSPWPISPPPAPPGGMSAIGTWSFWRNAPLPESCSLTGLMPVQYASHAKVGTVYLLNNAAIDEIASSSSATSSLPPTPPPSGAWTQLAVDGRYLCIDDSHCSSGYTTAHWDWWDPRWGQKIGNRRISFSQVAPKQVSALAKQGSGGAIGPWSSGGIDIFKVSHEAQTTLRMP
eukprot:COSAG02_NODE_5590_length_4207_cov_1.795034_2_plen_261_part_00